MQVTVTQEVVALGLESAAPESTQNVKPQTPKGRLESQETESRGSCCWLHGELEISKEHTTPSRFQALAILPLALIIFQSFSRGLCEQRAYKGPVLLKFISGMARQPVDLGTCPASKQPQKLCAFRIDQLGRDPKMQHRRPSVHDQVGC